MYMNKIKPFIKLEIIVVIVYIKCHRVVGSEWRHSCCSYKYRRSYPNTDVNVFVRKYYLNIAYMTYLTLHCSPGIREDRHFFYSHMKSTCM